MSRPEPRKKTLTQKPSGSSPSPGDPSAARSGLEQAPANLSEQADQALRAREALYRRAIVQAGAVPYQRDYRSESFSFIGEGIEEITGYSPEELTPQLWDSIVEESVMRGEGSGLTVEEAVRKARAGELRHFKDECRIRTRSGEMRWIADSSVEIVDEKARPIGSIGILQDITDHKQTEEELQEANRKLASWVHELEQRNREITLLNELVGMLQTCGSVQEAYVIIAQSCQFLFPEHAGALYLLTSNDPLLKAVGFWGKEHPEPAEFNFADCRAFVSGRTHIVSKSASEPACRHAAEAGPHLCAPLIAQGHPMGILHLRAGIDEGNKRQATDLPESKQRLAVAVAGHVALALNNLKLRETLREQSIRDPVTGLFNRRYMEESLEREMRRARRNRSPLGIVMLDLDFFKRFNDRYGHEAGDELLRALGEFLRSNIRGADIACRYGGEEFTLILPDTSCEITRLRAEQMRAGFKQVHLTLEGRQVGVVTISAGVAAFPDHGDDMETVLREADKALYRAKDEGRDRVVVADRDGSD